MLLAERTPGEGFCIVLDSGNVVSLRVSHIEADEVWLEIEQTDQQTELKIELQGTIIIPIRNCGR
jgi:hypothetical protein